MSLESHDSISRGKQRMVTTTTDVPTRMEMRATLTDDDAAGTDPFATEALDSEVLRVAVSAVSARSYTLLMCHGCPWAL